MSASGTDASTLHGPSLTLRPAVASDRDLLLAWANDPLTRASSFHQAPIEPLTHDAWFARRLAMTSGRIWIGIVGDVPIGQVRIDRDGEGRGEVGISVAPDARGRGFARPLLRAGMRAAETELGVSRFVARVRRENDVSLRLFRGAGFGDEIELEVDGVACRVLAHPVAGTEASR